MQQRHDEGHTVNDPTRTFRHATRSSAAGDTRGATFEPLEPRVLLSADLTGSFQPLPGTAGVGAPVVIALDLENIGDTKGKGSVPIDVYLSSDDVLDISDTLLATTKGKASIAPGESKPGKPIKKLTVPSSVAPGGYRLIAVIDPDELTEDDDRSNNTVVSQSITITPPDYDLSVALDTGKMPASLLAGSPKAKAKVRVLISKSGDTPLDKKQTVDIRVIARPAGIVGNAQDLVLVDLAGAKLGNPKEGKPKKFNLKPDLSGIPAGEYDIAVEIMGVGLQETNDANNMAVSSAGIVMTALVPTSISGWAFDATISKGTGSFASKGKYTFVLSASDDRYVLIGDNGVSSSTGTFIYNQVDATTAIVSFRDSLLGDGEGVLEFTSTTTGTLTLTSGGAMQVANVSRRMPAAPTAPLSLAARTVTATVDSGTGAFADRGSFQIALSDQSNRYVIAASGPVQSSFGTYSYEVFAPNVGILSFDDSGVGSGWAALLFETGSRADYVFTNVAGDVQNGSLQLDSVPIGLIAPSTVAGRTVNAVIDSGQGPFARSGGFQLWMSNVSNTYTLQAGPGTFNSSGTYLYERFTPSTGVLEFFDTLAGHGFGLLAFTSVTQADFIFWDVFNSGWQRGSMTFV